MVPCAELRAIDFLYLLLLLVHLSTLTRLAELLHLDLSILLKSADGGICTKLSLHPLSWKGTLMRNCIRCVLLALLSVLGVVKVLNVVWEVWLH